MMTIKLSLDEYENFRAIAERYNVKFDVKVLRDGMYAIKAPRDKLLEWGYGEEQEPGA
jgi:hypothetical protein